MNSGRGGRFPDGSEKQKRLWAETSANAKDPRMVKILPEPSTAARLITLVQLRRVKPRVSFFFLRMMMNEVAGAIR